MKKKDDPYTPERHLPDTRTARAQPQWHTAAGTAALTTIDTGNTVPQRANPTQTAYARPKKGDPGPGSALRLSPNLKPEP